MKIALLTALIAAGAGTVAFQLHAGSGCCGGCEAPAGAAAPLEDGALVGDYLEVRNATVFGGACHINAEVLGQGQRALLAWSFDGGTLADVRVCAAVEGEANLAKGAERRSVLWVDAPDDEARAAAAYAIQGTQREALGEVLEVHVADIAFARQEDGHAVSIDGVLAVETRDLTDDACCTMPENRWYQPAAYGLGWSKVGFTEEATFEGVEGITSWTYGEANTTQYGRFELRPQSMLDVSTNCCSVAADDA